MEDARCHRQERGVVSRKGLVSLEIKEQWLKLLEKYQDIKRLIAENEARPVVEGYPRLSPCAEGTFLV